MTSPTTASDRRGLPTALGGYSSGLSVGRSSAAARSVVAAPGIGDAFADVFRMIASVEGPSTPTAMNAPTDASPPESDEAPAAEAVESENEVSEAEPEPETNAASLVPAQPLAETEAETETASSESEPSVGPVADADADSDPDADARAESDAAASAATPSLEEQPLAADAAADQQTAAEANADAAADAATVAGTNLAASAELDGTLNAPTSTPDAAATAATAATELSVEGSGEPTATTGEADAEADVEEVVLARYAGEPQDAADRKSSGSHRRLRGQSRGERSANDAAETDRPVSTPSASSAAGTQASNAAAQASAATNVDPSSLASGQLAFAEPVATAAVLPPATAAAQTLPAAAAASATEALKGSGSDPAATTRTGTAPPAGSEPTVSKDVRAATAGKEANEGPRVADRALLVQRVSRAFQRLGFDGGQVRIRLHPEELGGVQLQLSVQGQRMSGRVVAETEAARSILTQHLPELRQRLADQGMQVERLEVQLEGEQDSTSGSDLMNRDSAGQGRAGQGDRSPQRGPRRQVEPPTLPIERTATAPPPGGGARSVIEAARQKTVDLIG